MAPQRMDPEPEDGEFIEVPTEGFDPSHDAGLANQPWSTIGPLVGANLGRGWYSVGAARRGPALPMSAIAFFVGFLIGPSVTWLVWGIPGSPFLVGPAASAALLVLVWRLGAPRRLVQGWIVGFCLHLTAGALAVLSWGSTLD